jgi:hypothetical protein
MRNRSARLVGPNDGPPLVRSVSALSHSHPICLSKLTYSWFQQNKWSSFQRQLNHYEFKRITTGTDLR